MLAITTFILALKEVAIVWGLVSHYCIFQLRSKQNNPGDCNQGCWEAWYVVKKRRENGVFAFLAFLLLCAVESPCRKKSLQGVTTSSRTWIYSWRPLEKKCGTVKIENSFASDNVEPIFNFENLVKITTGTSLTSLQSNLKILQLSFWACVSSFHLKKGT